MTRHARWGLQECHGPGWAGSEPVDADYVTIAVFLTKTGARWWRLTRGLKAPLRLVRLDKP